MSGADRVHPFHRNYVNDIRRRVDAGARSKPAVRVWERYSRVYAVVFTRDREIWDISRVFVRGGLPRTEIGRVVDFVEEYIFFFVFSSRS